MAKICLQFFWGEDNITRNRFAIQSLYVDLSTYQGITVYLILRCSTLICCLAKTS